MPYDKGDFTQQGIDGKVSGGLLLNNKRDVDVLVSTNEDDSTLGLVTVTVEDHLNDLHYAFWGENLEAGEVYEIGGSDDSTPFPYVTIHIVNEDTDSDLYASYRESGYYLGSFLHSNFDNELDYYLPSVGYSSSQFTEGTILAEKNGGTATIYTLNKLIKFYESGQIVDVNGVFSYIDGLSTLTFTDMVNMSVVRQAVYSGDTYNIYGLADTTKNGEITIKINNGGR